MNDTELAPRIYTYLHGKILTQRRKGRGALCPFVLMSKTVAHRKSQKNTETLLRMLFCESLRRLRETIPRRLVHYYLLPSTCFQSRIALLTTNY